MADLLKGWFTPNPWDAYESRTWRVTVTRSVVHVVRDVQAPTEEQAKEIALEWLEDDRNCELVDSGIESVQAELDEEAGA